MTEPVLIRLRVVSERPLIRMATAPNAGPKTLDGTHTYVLGDDPAYVIDPGPHLPTYIESLAEQLRTTNTHVHAIFLSHGHPDHAPGATTLAALLLVPVFASPVIDRLVLGDHIDLRSFAPSARFPIAEDAIEILESPGHSQDHVAFWLPSARILIAGDTVLGRGTTLVQPPEGDMTEYMHTLDRFVALKPRLLLPGHGPIVEDPAAKLAEYIEHRKLREQQVLTALSLAPCTPDQLVTQLYADLSPDLRALAFGSVQGILAKLLGEHRVTHEGEVYRAIRSQS